MTSVDRGESLQIDSKKFVRENSHRAGRVPVAQLPRLAESLAESNGALDYALQAQADARGRPVVGLQVKGKVRLQCQRCLEIFERALAIDTVLRLVEPERLEQEYDDDPSEPDVIAHSRTLDLLRLIEDEVLLALPAHPRHPQGECMVGEAGREATSPGEGEAAEKVLAFSALRALKQGSIQSKE